MATENYINQTKYLKYLHGLCILNFSAKKGRKYICYICHKFSTKP